MVEKETLKKVGIGLGIGVAAGVVAPLAATAVLGAAGFSAGGVVAGSVAAGAQAAIGNVAAGSFFALCQSVGAAGFATSTVTGVAAAGAGAGGVLGGLWPGDKKTENEALDSDNGAPKDPKDNNEELMEEQNIDSKDENRGLTTVTPETEALFIVKNDGTIYMTKRQKNADKPPKGKDGATIEENTYSMKENETLFKEEQNKASTDDEDYGLSLNNEEGTQTEASFPISENNEEKLSLHLDVRTPIGWGISAGFDSTRGCIKQTTHSNQ